MEKPLFEQMGGTYTRVGDYYLPALTLPTEKENISVYGDRDMQSIWRQTLRFLFKPSYI